MDDHAGLLGQRAYAIGRIRADQVQLQVRHGRADAREDFRSQPQRRVDVRRMAETAHERQVAALIEPRGRNRDIMDVGEDGDLGLRRQ
ncbi:hypothetical protein D3C83_102420 [compost metagenome]